MNLERHALVLGRRRGAYRDCFEGPDQKPTRAGAIVLADLFHLCGQGRAVATRDVVDPLKLAVMDGKRQVYLHIVSMLRADDEDLWKAAQQQAREMNDLLEIRG